MRQNLGARHVWWERHTGAYATPDAGPKRSEKFQDARPAMLKHRCTPIRAMAPHLLQCAPMAQRPFPIRVDSGGVRS